MESSWDIVFACKVDILNNYIALNRIPLLRAFTYQNENGTLKAEIPEFKIGWAGNEQYMALEIEMTNVVISALKEEEKHEKIKCVIHMQYSFTEDEKVKFLCTSEAKTRYDLTIGAVWVEEADLEGRIQSELLRDVFPGFLTKALIQNNDAMEVVLASLQKKFFELKGIKIVRRVPAFQNLNGTCVMAVMCMTHETQTEPPRQFSPELLHGYDYGYIFSKTVFLEHILLPDIINILNVENGKFKLDGTDTIINDGTVKVATIKVSATHYIANADLLKVQFLGDNMHLLLNGSADFTGLADSYITYSFHAVRRGIFNCGKEEKIIFERLEGTPDEYHSDKHIPLWIEITAGIFTFGLFSLISECISDEIQDRIGERMNEIRYNGKEEGYSLKWGNIELKFCDGGFEENFFMRGRV